MEMYCRQCEQTAKGSGCTVMGVCGKSPEVAALQDLLIYVLKGVGWYGHKAVELGVRDAAATRFVIEALFATVTNVDFDPERLAGLVRQAAATQQKLATLFLQAYQAKNGTAYSGAQPAQRNFQPAATTAQLVAQGLEQSIPRQFSRNEDVRSVQELFLYGLKGVAAYADHAWILGEQDAGVNDFFYKGLSALTNNDASVDELVALTLEQGKVNYTCMQILDKAHNVHYGQPVPTAVSTGVKKGPAIIVSGHDLLDLEILLKQTQGKGVNVYTHGEMLPAHGYPKLKQYAHLAGHFGSAWQNQQIEFDAQPAVFLFTTNCIQKPLASYQDRIFTTGLVAWPGVAHIAAKPDGGKDFTPVIQRAIQLGGFAADKPGKQMVTGFGHQAILGVADKVVAAVKSGAVKHFFLVGGCDGAKPGRNYYTEFAQQAPKDSVILTLACGKFRFNDQDFGDIGGIPRLLDVGQCNDAYGAIVVASALAQAFNCGVNELPLSLILSWYEQKAVCILITLLALGIKNIRIGPSLPAFVTPNILKALVDNFNIMPISTAEKDLAQILGK